MIVNIYGTSDSGKTTKVVEVIKRLSDENIKVASIKHTKGEFTIDAQGKDSYKHQEAGSKLTVLATALETDFIVKDVLELPTIIELMQSIKDVEVIVIEGYKELELETKDNMKRLTPDEVDVEKLVDEIKHIVKIEHAQEELPGLDCGKCGNEHCSDFAREIIEKDRDPNDCHAKNEENITVLINGKPIFMGNFATKITKNTVMGLINSLKYEGEIKDLKIEIRELD